MGAHRDETGGAVSLGVARGTEDLPGLGVAASVAAEGSSDPGERRATRPSRARRRLQQLGAIGSRLVQLDSIERAVPEVLDMIGQALPLERATVLLEASASRPRRAIQWPAADASPPLGEPAEAVVSPPPLELPLMAGARALGVLELRGRGPLDETDRVFAAAVANQLAAALDRRQAADASQARSDDGLVAEAASATGALLAASLDHRSALSAVVRSAVPLLADLCFIEELQDDGRVERVEILFADPSQQHLADRIRRFASQPDWTTPGGRVLRTGESVLVTDPTPELLAHDEAHAAAVTACGLRSLMAVPLRARGRALGSITFATTVSGRRYGPGDLALAEEIARRAAYAIDNARLYESAQHAVRARDEVMAVVAHDLAGPLSTILGNTNVLQLGGPGLAPAIRARTLSAMERAATRMKHLIGDLLDAGTLEAGRLRLDRASCDVGDLLEEAADLYQTAAAKVGLELVCRRPVDDVELVCDRDRLLQVLANLVGNALKFTGRGTVTVEAERRGGDVVVSVSDEGSGIAAADLPRVFDRYWRAGEADRPGNGLGLSIVRDLVQAHGGRVWVESQPGAGSCFRFSIPLAPSPGPG